MLKYLTQFFDWSAFADGKTFICAECSDWTDYNTKQHLGTKVNVVITKDETSYRKKRADGSTNIYEKLTFKVPKDIQIPQNTEVVPVNVCATVYGDYNNQLSVTCEDVVAAMSAE